MFSNVIIVVFLHSIKTLCLEVTKNRLSYCQKQQIHYQEDCAQFMQITWKWGMFFFYIGDLCWRGAFKEVHGIKHFLCTLWYFVTKVVLTYCEKNCSSDREKLLKFEAESWVFSKILRSLEQFIQTVKGQNKFW